MKKTTFRLLSLFLVMFAMSLPSQASDLIDAIRNAINESHYYSRVTAHVVGEGKVYVSFNATSDDPAYTTPKSSANSGTTGVENSGDHTYYLYAQANEGNEFVGWYTDASCTDLASTDNPFTATVSSHQGSDIPDDGTGADHYFYAKFVPETVSVTISAAGYATFCSEKAVDFTGSGITASWATKDGSSLTLNSINKVPANEGVILQGPAGTVNVPVILPTETETVEGNCLIGVTAETTIQSTDYILNVKNGVAGFYRAGQYTTLAANRAYISGETLVKNFIFGEDDATGIETIENAVEDGAIYNMAGQRLNKMQKGINIVNGKKILKK